MGGTVEAGPPVQRRVGQQAEGLERADPARRRPGQRGQLVDRQVLPVSGHEIHLDKYGRELCNIKHRQQPRRVTQ